MRQHDFIDSMVNAMRDNNGKIPLEFIDGLLHSKDTKVTHIRPTPNTRVCVITLPTGHDLVGYAQVLDENGDIELKGQEVAYNRAKEQIWVTLGSIAKVVY